MQRSSIRNLFSWLAVASGGLAVALTTLATASPSLETALEEQRLLVMEEPGNAGALNDLGNLLILAGDPEEAEETYRRALELDETSVPAHYNLGLLLLERGKERQALAQFREVVDLEPDNAWGHYQVGSLLESRGAVDGALKAYSKAFALDPDLAFPEHNPQVIENELITEALLLAYRSLDTESAAPKTYSNPSRIARLLMPANELAPPAEEIPLEADGETASRNQTWNGSSGDARVDSPYDVGQSVVTGGLGDSALMVEPGESRVLREDDLDRDSKVGQTVPTDGGAGEARRGGYRNQPSSVTRVWPSRRPNLPQGGNAGSTYQRRQEGGFARQTERGSQPNANRGQSNRVQPNRGRTGGGAAPRFRPGVRSTGHLDLQLEILPERQQPAERTG